MLEIDLIILIFLSAGVFECFIDTPVDDSEANQRSYYSNEDKAKIMKVYFETDTGERGHERRMKERWDQLNGMEMPQTGHNLLIQAMRWIKKGYAEKLLTEQERTSANPNRIHTKIKWSPEMKENVLKFYFATNPEKWKQSKRMKELWDNCYPEHHQTTGHNLMTKARELLKERGEDPGMKALNFTENQKIDLLNCHVESLKYKGEETKKMREFFIKKYPQYAKASAQRLYLRVTYIQRRQPEFVKKHSERISELDIIHNPREPGERSGSERGESIPFVIFPSEDVPGSSEQYFNPDRDNAWINQMIAQGSSLEHYAFPNIVTSHRILYPEDHYASLHVDTSHQKILDDPKGHHTLPDVGTSYQSIPGHYKDHHVLPGEGTSLQKTHLDDARKHDATLGKGTSHKRINSRQYHLDERQKNLSKGKETALD